MAPIEFRRWFAHHGEACLFWTLTLAHLLPVWAFRYFPTQDGPVHMSSAVILRDYGSPGTHYHEVFDLRLEPFPNWTSHLLLAGLMFVVPPLVAEKILVSTIIIGLAGALRYFCGTWGERTRPLALVGLLFVFNRCLWLGFYNFCLSLPLGIFILAYWLRRRDNTGLPTAAMLTWLLALSFFTHLVGFFATLLGLGWLTITSPKHRWRNVGWVTLACLPALLFTADYFDRTGFFGSTAAKRLGNEPLQWLHGQGSWARLEADLIVLDRETFAYQAQDFLPLGPLVLALYAMLTVLTFVPDPRPERTQAAYPARWPLAVLGSCSRSSTSCCRTTSWIREAS